MEEINSEIFLRTCTKHEDIGSIQSPRGNKDSYNVTKTKSILRGSFMTWSSCMTYYLDINSSDCLSATIYKIIYE